MPNHPPEWGRDILSIFIRAVDQNTVHNIATIPNHFQVLVALADVYEGFLATRNFLYSGKPVENMLAVQAYSAFLGACRMVLGGQISETFILARGALESALYALAIFDSPELKEIWMKREENMAEFRKEFSCGRLLERVRGVLEPETFKTFICAYETSYEYGVHPEQAGAFLRMKTKEERISVDSHVVSSDLTMVKNAIVFTANVGLMNLVILEKVFAKAVLEMFSDSWLAVKKDLSRQIKTLQRR